MQSGMLFCLRLLVPVALVAGLCSCSTVDAVSGRSAYNLYTLDQDIQMGVETLAANTQQLREQGVAINADQTVCAELNAIVARLSAVSDLPDLPYNVTLYHTNIVNAAAAPGGSIFVFEGLYDPEVGLVRDEDELAAVLAHEIAHVNCRHSTERLSKLLTYATMVEIGAQVAEHEDESDLATAIRALFAVGTAFYIPIHSRTDEFEADRVGLFYMAKAGYDPRAAPRIWKRVAEEQEKGSHDKASIFATHPSSWDRYQALERMLPYAIAEYVQATGHYPPLYDGPRIEDIQPAAFNWRDPD